MTGQYPRLRSHTRKRKSGKVVTYYVYDRRPEGLPDIALGKDYEEAKKRWDEIHNHAPRIAGTIMQAFEAWEREILPAYESKVTRRNYAQNLRRLKPVFGPASWDAVEFPQLKSYLKKRTAKTQANREMACFRLVWNYARGEGMTKLPWPAAGMEKSRWLNKENPRHFEVTDALFDAVYAQADPVLKDCMDLASATGMRLTDCRTVALPKGDLLHLKASKTGKKADFDLSLSAVLPELIARRRATPTNHVMLLTTPASNKLPGRRISETMLRDRYEAAREKAAEKARLDGDEALAEDIESMYLRDMRKRAADAAETDEDARELLQHDDVRTTKKHYRTKVTRLRPSR